MKKLILIITVFFTNITFAQDLIILKNGDEINAKVTEVYDQGIKYKKTTFLDGPDFNLKNSQIFMIKYSNGEKVIFNSENTLSNSNDKKNYNYSEIQEGVNVPLYLARTISSKSISVGSVIELRVKDAIVDKNNYVLIKANQIVYATINEARRAKGLGKKGELNIMIQHIKAIDGTKIPAYLNLGSDGKDRSGAAWGVGLFLFWPALFMKGKEAELKAGTIINAQISENREILVDEKRRVSSGSSQQIPSPNSMELPLINDQNVDCGEKPRYKGGRQAGYQSNKAYKEYLRSLRLWKECTNQK